MNKVKAYVRWTIGNSIFMICIVLGLIKDVSGAKNVAFLMAWITIVCSFMVLHKDILKAMQKKEKIAKELDQTFDWVVIAFFAWYGHIVTAIFYVIATILMSAAWAKPDSNDRLTSDQNP